MQKKLFQQPFVRYLKNSLLINNEILVFGDLHLGYEDEIVREGIIPNVQLREVFDDLDEIFDELDKEKVSLKEIVILGDLKQEFGVISENEWRDVSRFVDFLKKKCGRIVILKGNHDLKLGPILRKRGIEMRDYYEVEIKGNSERDKEIRNLYINKITGSRVKKGVSNQASESKSRVLSDISYSKRGGEGRNIYFLHGNKLEKGVFKHLFKQGLDRQIIRQTNRQKDILVLGHLHPAISLADEYKKERYKCFLCGNLNDFIVYILPSFSSVGYGYDLRNLMLEGTKLKGKKIRKHDFFIIPDKDLMKFNIVVYDSKNGKELEFGELKELIK